MTAPTANFDLSRFTTFGIGGPARWAQEIASIDDLESAWRWARLRNLEILFVGAGSNLLFGDEGFGGLVLINRIAGIDPLPTLSPATRDSADPDKTARQSERASAPRQHVRVGGGVGLMELIRWCHPRGLAGLERMYGIPGTVAGAIVGNAGAYGQEIQESVVEVSVWTPAGLKVIPHAQCDFRYRHSVLNEHRDWMLAHCVLGLRPSGEPLQQISENILKTREVKYPPGLRCPGSFFKNVEVASLPPHAAARIPPDLALHGKVSAGRLLETVGACGARRGQAMIAAYHGNLFLNLGGATCRDVLSLASEYSAKVRDRFSVRLEPEVLIVNGAWDPEL